MFVPGKDGAPEDPLISLFYTSGSTGLPKGAMYSEQLWRRYWCAPCRSICGDSVHDPIYVTGGGCIAADGMLAIYLWSNYGLWSTYWCGCIACVSSLAVHAEACRLLMLLKSGVLLAV